MGIALINAQEDLTLSSLSLPVSSIVCRKATMMNSSSSCLFVIGRTTQTSSLARAAFPHFPPKTRILTLQTFVCSNKTVFS